MDTFEEIDISSEQIDQVYQSLEDMGIEIVGDKVDDMILEKDDDIIFKWYFNNKKVDNSLPKNKVANLLRKFKFKI